MQLTYTSGRCGHGDDAMTVDQVKEVAARRCDADDLLRFTQEVLEAVGTPTADAREMATQIVSSELAGHESHGMRRLAEYIGRADSGHAQTASSPEVDLDLGSLVRLDGNGGWGHVVLSRATRLTVERAKSHGIAGVAVHNCEYAGRFADFCQEAADDGIAILVFVKTSGVAKDVAPPGGLEGRFSTNPIAMGIPRARKPHLVLDIATSTVALGRIAEWEDRGEAQPADWVNEHGVLQTFGGAKGFGLALVAEALGGVLTTAGTASSQPSPELQGVFMIGIDVERLRPLADFGAELDEFLDYVKDTPVASGTPPVAIPGERTAGTTRQRRAEGVPVQEFSWKQMSELAGRFGVTLPTRRAV